MKIISLTFAYDMSKLLEIGRFWAKDVYINKDFIFEYSAASYATFLDKNPDLTLNLYTDDTTLIKSKLGKYKVDMSNVVFHDYTEKLLSYKGNLKYSFDVLHDFITQEKSKDEYTIKIDCDLTFYDKLPRMNDDSQDVLVWKYERMLNDGDPRMGEIKSSKMSIGDANYKIFNIGLLGIPNSYNFDELNVVYRKMADVDILDVSDLRVNSWHCAEQTSKNWLFHKYNYNIIETYDIVDHCFDNKGKCIENAKYLLK